MQTFLDPRDTLCAIFEGIDGNNTIMAILLLICTLLLCSNISAQQPISFEEAVSIMLENNKSITSTRHSIEAARLEQRATEGLRWPHIDIHGGYLYLQKDIEVMLGGAKGAVTESVERLINGGISAGIITPDAASLIDNALSPLLGADWGYTLQKQSLGGISATLEMPIYAGGRINIVNRVAKLETEATNITLEALEGELIVTLVERYFGVVLAEALYDVEVEAMQSVERHLHDAKALYDEGMVPRSVVLYVEYRLSEARRSVTAAENRVTMSHLALKSLLGINYEIKPIVKLFVYNNIYNINYFIDNAHHLNPIIREANIGQQLANEGVKLARAALLPEVVALGAASIYNYQLSNLAPRWAVGIGINLTIFDGLGKERRYMAAKVNEAAVNDMVESAKSDISLLVEKEYFELINAKQNIESSRYSIAFAEEYYNSIYEGFVEGIASSSDIIDASVELSATKVKYLNAAYDYCISLVKLLNASGIAYTFVNYLNNGESVYIN